MQEVMDALSNAKTRKKAPVKKGKKAVAPPYESKNKDKKQSIVEMTLPEDNNQIFASKYQTVLPSKDELKKILEQP